MKPSITSAAPKKPSPGQKENVVTLVTDATRKGMGVAFDELADNGVLNKDNVERIRAKGDVLVAKITQVVKEHLALMAELIAGCLKLISGAETLELEPTDGKQTIAKAEKVFTWGIDSDFRNWGCDVKAEPTNKQNVHVHEMVKDGTFAKIFGGLSENLDELCLTQAQIIQFVQKHKKWLRTEGYATFFLFKVGEEFFVARVGVRGDGSLHANVNRISRVHVWLADLRHRVVVPQLALKN